MHNLSYNISKEKYTEKWAMTNLALGYAYDERKKDEIRDNTEKVLKHYKQALNSYNILNITRSKTLKKCCISEQLIVTFS